VDTRYRQRAAQARSRPDIAWGAYHFCTGASVETQLKLALSRVGYDSKGPHRTMMVFDFERNSHNKRDYMRVKSLAHLVRRFKSTTGVYPMIYVNPTWFNQRVRADRPSKADLAVIKRCPVWTSAYGAPPRKTVLWNDWTIWQYSGDSSQRSYGDRAGTSKYPRGVRGVGSKLEMNIYKGSNSQLKALFRRHSIPTRL